MVQTVIDAQGTAHEFPDEATPTMISQALGATYTPPQAPYQGSVLPITVDPQGNTHFDINQGVTGALIRAFTAPGDVYKGNLDPTSPEGLAAARSTAMLMSPLPAATRAGARAIPGEALSTNRAAVAAPTEDALRAAADTGYTAARATGAEYPASSVADMATQAQQSLYRNGFIPKIAPQTHAVLDELANPPAGSFSTITDLDAARRALNHIGGNFQNPPEQAAARAAIGRIDDLIANAGSARAAAGGVPGAGGSEIALAAPAENAGAANGAGLGGAAEDPLVRAGRLITEARANAAAAFRSGRITDAEDAATLRAAATNSGQNGGNAMRQRLATILNSDKASRGYSPDELAAMRQVVQGTATSNTLRRVSNMLGGGGGLGQTGMAALGGGLGFAIHGPTGAGFGAAAAPFIGSATRSAYNNLVDRQVGQLAALMRQRSPLYQGLLANAPMAPNVWDRNAFLATRGLLGSMLSPQPTAPAEE